MRTIRSMRFVFGLSLVVGAWTSIDAETLVFTATIDGEQANACDGTDSPATGTGTFTLDTDTGEVTYEIGYASDQLLGPETNAHVHGVAERCVNAGVVFQLPPENPKVGTTTLTSEQQSQMIDGLFYVNIHTSVNPGGEIRGQIELAPPAEIVAFTTTIDGAQADACNGTDSPATGAGTFTLDTATGEMTYEINYTSDQLLGPETNAHIHGTALPCTNAGVVIPLPAENPKVGTVVLTPEQQTQMISGLFYVNIHTSVNPGGEIRGQIVQEAAFLPRPGGWDYSYEANPGEGVGGSGSAFDALDGTWSHQNGSDEWDGLPIGEGHPGGAGIFGGAISYLRVQETGDPRDHEMGDPGSNRKVYLGHDISADGASGAILDEGVTLNFRVRIPTTPPLDDLHPDGGGEISPYPAGGDGYLLHDGGKGNIGIKQADGGVISFSLATDSDTAGAGAGLLTNNLNGSAISGDVDSGEAGTTNLLALDPTEWHDFWVNIRSGGEGTHQVTIYLDGATEPAVVFDVTAGSGSDFADVSYIAIGAGSTGQSGALDVDFFRFASGVHLPFGTAAPTGPAQIGGDCNQDGSVDINDVLCEVRLLFEGFDLLDRSPQEAPCGAEDGDLSVLDVNGDSAFNTSDITLLATFLFGGGAPPSQGTGCFVSVESCGMNPGCQ